MAPGGLVVAFRGDLGAGKTVMAKGIGRGLGIEDEVTSPTFTVLSEYEGRLRLHHMDAYRLLGPEDFAEMGGEEILADPGGLSLIEWSERIAEALPSSTESIDLRVRADGSRLALVEGRALESIAVDFARRTPGDAAASGQEAAFHGAASREEGR
jgi:tRNA threonylcarbamoyladenosine biosynthesis protein TsaE